MTDSDVMFGRMFGRCGEWCARRQWEVIVATVTFTVCMLSAHQTARPLLPPSAPPSLHTADSFTQPPLRPDACPPPKTYTGPDAVLMTAVRCIAILYTYHQFRKLHQLGSKYLLGCAGLFIVISTCVFTSSIFNFMHSGLGDLKDALFFFLLLVDLSKVSRLSQYALTSPDSHQLAERIGAGMTMLGPQVTLDVIVEVLLISVGTLSGIYRLEVLCCYACMSAIVSYVMFITFYPAFLSLFLEMSCEHVYRGESGASITNNSTADKSCHFARAWSASSASFLQLLHEDETKLSNAVARRVKIIMCVALSLVHFASRCLSFTSPDGEVISGRDTSSSSFSLADSLTSSSSPSIQSTLSHLSSVHASLPCDSAVSSVYGALLRWMSISAEQLVILILVLALVAKYILFEHKDSSIPSILRQNSTSESCVAKSSGNSDNNAAVSDASCQTGITTLLSTSATHQPREVAQNDNNQSDLDEDFDEDRVLEQPALRSLHECARILQLGAGGDSLSDGELLQLLLAGQLRSYQLEKQLASPQRAVRVRRQLLARQLQSAESSSFSDVSWSQRLASLPHTHYDYERVVNSCCENVVGYVPVPVGVAGPLLLNGQLVHIPLATTEGALVASTNRGCVALRSGSGVSSYIVGDGMTRAPVLECPSAKIASEVLLWLDNSDNMRVMREAFDSTSRFARLRDIQASMFGRQLFLRFVARTGDAMGMNMVSKGTEKAINKLREYFPCVSVTSVSSNVCTDKKSAAVNWIRGRGKWVVCEAIVPARVVHGTLKTSTAALVNLCVKKNLMGAAVAGSLGGNNAHAANIVTAIYIATGQDPAQNVGSSSCMTLLESCGNNSTIHNDSDAGSDDLYITCTMPCVEVGTVGGGTGLSAQRACLEMIGCQGASVGDSAGSNASRLASIVCATVLAGELSLLSAQSAGHLVNSHMTLNRKNCTSTSS